MAKHNLLKKLSIGIVSLALICPLALGGLNTANADATKTNQSRQYTKPAFNNKEVKALTNKNKSTQNNKADMQLGAKRTATVVRPKRSNRKVRGRKYKSSNKAHHYLKKNVKKNRNRKLRNKKRSNKNIKKNTRRNRHRYIRSHGKNNKKHVRRNNRKAKRYVKRNKKRATNRKFRKRTPRHNKKTVKRNVKHLKAYKKYNRKNRMNKHYVKPSNTNKASMKSTNTKPITNNSDYITNGVVSIKKGSNGYNNWFAHPEISDPIANEFHINKYDAAYWDNHNYYGDEPESHFPQKTVSVVEYGDRVNDTQEPRAEVNYQRNAFRNWSQAQFDANAQKIVNLYVASDSTDGNNVIVGVDPEASILDQFFVADPNPQQAVNVDEEADEA